MGDDSINGLGGGVGGGSIFLINPMALQSVLTQACCGKKVIAPEVTAMPLGENGENTSPSQQPPQQQHVSESPLLRHAVLMTKDGLLMCQSEGMEAEKAAFVAGLAANVWKMQHGMVEEQHSDGKNGSMKLKSDGTLPGDLDIIFMGHKDKSIAIAPCGNAYLVTLIADHGVQLGMLKSRALYIAKRLRGVLENVTPKSFVE